MPKAWKFRDNLNTDEIIPGRYNITIDPIKLAQHVFYEIKPEYQVQVQPGDVIIGGKNFGCGSSREHAPIAIKAAGVSCVVAKSFARIFYRNAFNMGLPILECEDAEDFETGEKLSVDFDTGMIVSEKTKKAHSTKPIPDFMQELVRCGGLMKHIEKEIQTKKV